MVTLTDHAATVVRGLIEQPGFASGTGLRIAANTARHTLMFSLVSTPASDDIIVESHGVTMFLDQGAAQMLDGKILDATTEADGKLKFMI
jgi:iron-sulfur cluster assembly protein